MQREFETYTCMQTIRKNLVSSSPLPCALPPSPPLNFEKMLESFFYFFPLQS
jgi:hypothetical protein